MKVNTRLLAAFILLKALIVKILKYIAVPFLYVWMFIRWSYVLTVSVITLLTIFIWSIIKGDWRL